VSGVLQSALFSRADGAMVLINGQCGVKSYLI